MIMEIYIMAEQSKAYGMALEFSRAAGEISIPAIGKMTCGMGMGI